MSDLSELIRQKENLLAQIQALEETCKGIENENNAKRVQELNLQQARIKYWSRQEIRPEDRMQIFRWKIYRNTVEVLV